MKVLLSVGAVLIVLLCIVSPSAATDKVLDVDQTPVVREVPVTPDVLVNQPPNQVNGLFSDTGCATCGSGVQLIADNFVVSTGGLGVDLAQVTIWGGRFPGNSAWPGDSFELYVMQNSGGVPGAAACSYTITPAATQTGVVLFGVNEYQVDFVLPTTCTLADGTYWLLTYTDTSGSADDFFWETGNLDAVNGIAGSVWAPEPPFPTAWNSDGGTDLSFQIQGAIVPVELQSMSVE